MKRVPVAATLVVLLCVGLMTALGVWQLRRADEKAALLAHYRAANALPEMAYPAAAQGEDLLFRRAAGLCLEPVSPRIEGGLSAKGETGWRHLVSCRTGAEGPGMTVDIGWSKGFDAKPGWKGGPVSGVISREFDHRSLVERALGRGQAPGLMLVARQPAPGLEASAPPSIADVPDNHMAYAVQWFVFAGIALIVYLLALRRRLRA